MLGNMPSPYGKEHEISFGVIPHATLRTQPDISFSYILVTGIHVAQ